LIQGVYPLPDELLLVLDTDRTVNLTKSERPEG
jgi:hypothetical protein